MLEPIIQYFNSITTLSDGLVEDLNKYAIIKEYKKDEFILKAGKVSDYTSWILKGLIRSYYLKDIEEITTKFLWEGAPVTSLYSYYNRKPGNENIVALEDTTLACMHYDHMKYLYHTYPEFNFVGRVITEKYLYMLEIEVYNLRKQTAADRYNSLVKHLPDLLQRVPLKYLATYLGMNLETLSRIRSGKR